MESNKIIELYNQLELIQRQIQSVESQLDEIVKQKEQVKTSVKALKDLSEEKSEEVLVPIVNGVFAKAKLLDTKKLLVSVGSNVLVSKSIDEAVKLLEDNVKELETYQGQLEATYKQLIAEFNRIQDQLSKLSGANN